MGPTAVPDPQGVPAGRSGGYTVPGAAAGPGRDDDRPALRRCTAVSPDDFAAKVWSRQESLSRADELPRDFADLFSLEAADRLLSTQGLRTPFVRVAKDGETLPNGRFTAGGGVGATIPDQVSDVKLVQLFAEGSTIVLQALHRTHPPLIDFGQSLGADLGHPVQVNAYITPPQSQGFSAHYDVHDVFVLQVAGEKRWQIRPPVHPDPLRNQPWTDRRAQVERAAQDDPMLDVVLRPGDALYLPRGFLHAATALGRTSAHLTVGVHVWTRRHLLEQLLAAVEDVEELRTSLPLGIDVTDPDALRVELTRSAGLLASHVPDVDVAVVARGLAGQALSTSRAGAVAPLAQALAVAELTLADTLRWRPGLRATVRPAGRHLVIGTPDGTVRLPADASRTLDRLRSGEVLTVADIEAPDDDARLGLARALMTNCLTVRP